MHRFVLAVLAVCLCVNTGLIILTDSVVSGRHHM